MPDYAWTRQTRSHSSVTSEKNGGSGTLIWLYLILNHPHRWGWLQWLTTMLLRSTLSFAFRNNWLPFRLFHAMMLSGTFITQDVNVHAVINTELTTIFLFGGKNRRVLTEGIIGIKSDVDRASEYTSKRDCNRNDATRCMIDSGAKTNKRTNHADDAPSLNGRSNKQVYKPKHPDPHLQNLRRHVSSMDCRQNNHMAKAFRPITQNLL